MSADEMNTPPAEQAAVVDVPAPRRRGGMRTTPTGRTLAAADGSAGGSTGTVGAVRIPGTKIGKSEWWYRPADRTVLQVMWETRDVDGASERVPVGEEVGTVPPVTGWVTKKNEDGQDTAVEYRLQHAAGHNVVVSEDDLDRGTWAGPLGMTRPSGRDAVQAFATVIREEAAEAPQVSGVPYMTEEGGMVLPEGDAQNLGYRSLKGDETEARKVWNRILQYAAGDPKTLLMLGAFFAGPLVAPLGVVAQIVNLTGDGQQGKSTTQTVQAAMFGRAEEGILRSWNASAQGITQPLRRARYLPLALEEESAGGMSAEKVEQMMSAMVGGANRSMGTADGNGAPSLGKWRSVISSSTNEQLRRPGQTEDLASRLYEVRTPFWHDMWVNRDGEQVPEGTEKAMHLSDWLVLTAQKYRGWPLEWAYQAGMLSADGIERARDLHNAARFRISPKGGGIPGTIGKVHALWAVGAHLLGLAVGYGEQLGPVAEAEAVRMLPDAVDSSSAAVLGPDERLWDAITGVMAKGRRTFPTVDNTQPGADDLRTEMDAAGADVHGFITGDVDGREYLWVIAEKLREVAVRADLRDVRHAGLTALRKRGVLVPDGKHSGHRPPRPFRSVKGIGSRPYRFDLQRAAVVYGGADDDEQGPDGGGNGGGPEGPQGDVGPDGGLTCAGCGQAMTADLYGDGMHAACAPVPANTWGAGTFGETAPAVDGQAPAAQAAVVDERQDVDEQAATAAPARRPAGPSRAEALAERCRTLDELETSVDVDDGEQVAKGAARLRLLAAMEGDRDGVGPCAPRLHRMPYRWKAEMPPVADAARVVNGWSFEQDYTGDAVVLDRNGAWPSAASSVVVAHGGYEHTGPVTDLTTKPRPGYYQVTVYPWTETGLPSPMEGETVGEQRWITAARFGLLVDLAAEGRWPDASAADSWTGEPVRLREWSELVRDLRTHALRKYGPDSAAYAVVKVAFGQCMGLMTGSLDGSGAQARKVWRCKTRRPDWIHAIKDQAAMTMWRAADAARRAGVPALALRNVDELVVPVGTLDILTGGERPVVKVDGTGVRLGMWKVKDECETWGDE